MSNNVLRMQNITKRFGPVTVLNDVSFEVKSGEVHALVGANGAGKSTLMKILNGIYLKSEGEIYLNDNLVEFVTPKDAFLGGVSMIHQELDLLLNLSVAENIFLGNELTKMGKLNREEMIRQSQELLDYLGFEIDAGEEVSHLSIAQQQLTLIARVVFLKSSLVVMDEPTSALSHSETEALFNIIRDLKNKGISIIFISHYLEEIFSVCDRVTVLRNGEIVTTANIEDTNEHEIVEWMVGHHVDRKIAEPKDFSNKKEMIKINNISQEKGIVHNISFSVKEGEVVGLAGAVGAGRTEILKLIIGAEKMKNGGSICLNGNETSILSPKQAVDMNIGFIPEDRKLEGLALVRSIGANIAVTELGVNSKFGFLKTKPINKLVKRIIDSFHVRCVSEDQVVSDLSGGNQQKVAIGKWLSGRFKLILFDQPTRGVDVGAKSEIYAMIRQLANENTSMIIASDEIEELQELCDRILVVKKGEIVHEFINAGMNVDKAEILEKMIG